MPKRCPEHWNFPTATTQPIIRIIHSSFTELVNYEANLHVVSVHSRSICLIPSPWQEHSSRNKQELAARWFRLSNCSWILFLDTPPYIYKSHVHKTITKLTSSGITNQRHVPPSYVRELYIWSLCRREGHPLCLIHSDLIRYTSRNKTEASPQEWHAEDDHEEGISRS